MMDADLLREASDPTTTGDRLVSIVSLTVGHVRCVAFGNPSLPLDLLHARLLDHPAPFSLDTHLAVWRNPAASLAMLVHPHRHYRMVAASLLHLFGHRSMIAHHHQEGPRLESLVAEWAEKKVAHGSRACEARDFARHLAGLFSLPWPEP